MARMRLHSDSFSERKHLDRRCEPRLEVSAQARIVTLGVDQSELIGTVKDLSAGGLRLSVDQPLRFEALVQVDIGDELLVGEVRYCQRQGRAYRVGVALMHRINKDRLASLLTEFGANDSEERRAAERLS